MTPRASRVNQATCFPASTAAWPRASTRNVLPVPASKQTTRFSARPIHSRVRSAAWVGVGSRTVRRPRRRRSSRWGTPPGPAGGQRAPVPAGDLLGDQHGRHLGGVPALRFRGGEDLGGGAADVWEPHPAWQRLPDRGQAVAGSGFVWSWPVLDHRCAHDWPRSPSSSPPIRSAMSSSIPALLRGWDVRRSACRSRRWCRRRGGRASRPGRQVAIPTPAAPRPRRRSAGRGHRRRAVSTR